jgi:transposase
LKARYKVEPASVPLPTSGININTVGKYQYVYHIGKGYRNEKSKPTSDKTSIGKLDEKTDMLIPNENYFAIYGGNPSVQMEIDSVLNFGDFFLLDSLAKDIGLTQVLGNVFGDMGDEILMLACYMSLTKQALYRCDGWCRETLTGRSKVITSQRCSRILEAVDEHKRMDFFRAWAHARQQKEYLAYDVTSISSHARGNDVVEYGYNRDSEDLPQVNLGMYYGEESKLPIFYCTYKGSIVDKSHLRYMMQYNERLGIKDVCFVMDGGFYSEANIRSMAHEHLFIVGMANGLALSKEMIAKYGQEVKSSRYDIGLAGANGIAIEDDRYSFRSKIHLFYSSGKIADEERIFKAKLARWEQDLLKGKTVKESEHYFHVTEDVAKVNRTVTRNFDAIDEHIHNLGYFLMMTTDQKKSPQNVLDIYRMKDVVEKCFDDLKNGLDMKRLRIHSEETMDGKMFVAFIGLILRSYVHNKLKDYLDTHQPVSLAQVFDELRMIKTVKTKDGMLLRNPVTKRQRTILQYFGKTEEDLDSTLKKYAGSSASFFDS